MTVVRWFLLLVGMALFVAGCSQTDADRAPVVLAASSMQESLTAAADEWTAAGHPRPVISFAASSALARQIESGADADLFISADEQWMDSVEKAGRLTPGSRHDLVGNSLVLIGPSGSKPIALEVAPMMTALGGGRLAMADPDSVPAGRYGKAALQSLGLWPALESRLARAENVRAALALVERGEAPLGIVYATDAKASNKAQPVAVIPVDSHPAIVYPMALLSNASADAKDFADFLLSPRGQAIFAAHGFTVSSR